MTQNSSKTGLFARLRSGLEDGIRFARGKVHLRTVSVPKPPPRLRPVDVARLRRRLGMSQQLFARTLNVSAKTVQSWEQGIRQPSQAALRLLQVLREKPEAVGEVIGA